MCVRVHDLFRSCYGAHIRNPCLYPHTNQNVFTIIHVSNSAIESVFAFCSPQHQQTTHKSHPFIHIIAANVRGRHHMMLSVRRFVVLCTHATCDNFDYPHTHKIRRRLPVAEMCCPASAFDSASAAATLAMRTCQLFDRFYLYIYTKSLYECTYLVMYITDGDRRRGALTADISHCY